MRAYLGCPAAGSDAHTRAEKRQLPAAADLGDQDLPPEPSDLLLGE
jgi:hypothetical protein